MSDLTTSIIAASSALLGVSVTGFIAARSEQRKERSLERQLAQQNEATDRAQLRELESEHKKWLRDRKQAAYQSFLNAMHESREANWQLYGTADPSITTEEDFANGANLARAARNKVSQVSYVVQLEGPEPVSAIASLCWEAMEIEYGAVYRFTKNKRSDTLTEDEERELRTSFDDTDDRYRNLMARFVENARAALNQLPISQ
ncbi:hypothetical protein [Streptomyces phaeochromogenes]|uniref:hypothetical protein n=1 Tax=Streptomyces phaeochromogenes TaxID=1923 RepID=UPI00386821A7|nr:hypothetical protein OHB08_18325 [Streptomyces phaeochromogenes]